MPRQDSELQEFLLSALESGKYPNLQHLDIGLFILRLVRKPRGGATNSDCGNLHQIFKDWDLKRGHDYEPSRSKNRLLVSMKNSCYLKNMKSSHTAVIYQFCTVEEIKVKKELKKEKEVAKRKQGQLRKNVDVAEGEDLLGQIKKTVLEPDKVAEDIDVCCSSMLCETDDILEKFQEDVYNINIDNEDILSPHLLGFTDLETFTSLDGFSSFRL